MNGTEYVIEQLGLALKASHNLIQQQAARITELEADLPGRPSADASRTLDGAASQ